MTGGMGGGGGGAVTEWVREFDWRPDGRGFESHCGKTFRSGTLAIPFTPICQCLPEETLKAVGPFYLVSMPGEVKDPTSPHWNVQLSWTPLPTLNSPRSPSMRRKTLPCTEKEEEDLMMSETDRLNNKAWSSHI